MDAGFVKGLCADCGKPMAYATDYYMVGHRIWKRITKGDIRILLHIGCLEARLGRKLHQRDFIKCPVNDGYFGFDLTRFPGPRKKEKASCSEQSSQPLWPSPHSLSGKRVP